jgi:hypothetical protein
LYGDMRACCECRELLPFRGRKLEQRDICGNGLFACDTQEGEGFAHIQVVLCVTEVELT